MATHSHILAWRIPRTEEPGGLRSIRLQRVEHNGSDLVRMHVATQGCRTQVGRRESQNGKRQCS